MAALRRAAGALVLFSALAVSTLAYAQDAVDVGVRQYREADFAAARRTLTTALAADALSRVEVGRALGALSAVDFALGDVDAMRAHVAALAVVAPGYAFGREIPPEILEAFSEARHAARPPRLQIETAGSGATRHVTVMLAGARAGLRELVLDCADDLGGRRVDRGPSPLLELERPAHCEARAVWLGGAVVATAAADVAFTSGTSAGAGNGWTHRAAATSEPPWLWIGVGIGAAVVIVVIVAVAVAASSGDTQYALSVPNVAW